MKYCYECGSKCWASNQVLVLCSSCEPEPEPVVTDREHPAAERPGPARPGGIVRAVNLAALVGLGLIFVLIAAFLAAAYYAS